MRENRHLLLEVFAFAFRAQGFAGSHDQGFKFLAAGTTDKIKQWHLFFSRFKKIYPGSILSRLTR
jgi:hypothetical protein